MTTRTRKTLEWALVLGGLAGAFSCAALSEKHYNNADRIQQEASQTYSGFSSYPELKQNEIVNEQRAGSNAFSGAVLSFIPLVYGGVSMVNRKPSNKP